MSAGKWWIKLGRKVNNCRLVKFTPKMAREILDNRNTRNRPISAYARDKIMIALESGEFVTNGETIVFDEDGVLVNGQHRLQAIWESGIPASIYCIFDVPSTSFQTIDTNKTRSGADTLAVNGYRNRFILSSAARLLSQHVRGRRAGRSKSAVDRASNTRTLKVVAAHPRLADVCADSHKFRNLASPAGIAFVWYVCNEIDAQKASTFFMQLLSGEGLSRGMPAHTLRERLLTNRSGSARISPDEELALIIKAAAAYFDGRTVMTLRYQSTEAWPVVPGDKLFGSEIEAVEAV